MATVAPAGALPPSTGLGWAMAQVRVASGNASIVNGRFWSSQNGPTAGSVTVSRSGPGRYTVDFDGLTEFGGIAHVVPWAESGEANPSICAVSGWGPTGTSQEVDVVCFDSVTGAPKDGRRFDVWYTNINDDVNSISKMTYLWANLGSSTTPYQPSSSYYFSDADAALPTITRVSRGVYDVVFEEPLDRSVPIVTAYSSQPRWCQPVSSLPSGGNGRTVRIACFRNGGVAADSQFDLTLSSKDPVSGYSIGGGLFIKRPSASGVQQPSVRNYNAVAGAGTNTHLNTGVGKQKVSMPLMRGVVPTVSAQAFGSRPTRCFVTKYVSSVSVPLLGGVKSRCISGTTGQPVDSRQWVVRTDRFLA